MIIPINTRSSILRYTDLEKQVWREIYTLSDLRIIKDRLKKQAKLCDSALTDEFATQKAKDIQYCVKQAKDYFASSKSATLLIKPTLIYYGMISLAAALIIYKDRNKSLNSMKEAHGLKDKYPDSLQNAYSGSITRNEILKISAEFQLGGTFTELKNMDLSEFFIMPIKNSNAENSSKDYLQKLNFGADNPNLINVNLLTLFQNIPEIFKELKLSLNKDSFTYPGEAVISNDSIICRFSNELCTTADLRQKFLFIENATLSESNDFYFFQLPRDIYTSTTPLTKRDIIGNQFLISDTNNPFLSTDFLTYYITFFILGSLARYKPALWRIILEDDLHGLSTIPEILCDSAYVKIPLYFLNEFTNNFYKI